MQSSSISRSPPAGLAIPTGPKVTPIPPALQLPSEFFRTAMQNSYPHGFTRMEEPRKTLIEKSLQTCIDRKCCQKNKTFQDSSAKDAKEILNRGQRKTRMATLRPKRRGLVICTCHEKAPLRGGSSCALRRDPGCRVACNVFWGAGAKLSREQVKL